MSVSLPLPLPISIGGTGGTDAATAAALLGVLGSGQTLQNMTASRFLNTIYTNTTGRPILVIVNNGATTSAAHNWGVAIDGVTRSSASGNSTVNAGAIGSFIVPSGSTYAINGVNESIGLWSELR